jgi:hypothetical protein
MTPTTTTTSFGNACLFWLLILSLAATVTNSYLVIPPTSNHRHSTCLDLVPSQGKQLAAASIGVYTKETTTAPPKRTDASATASSKDNDDDDDDHRGDDYDLDFVQETTDDDDDIVDWSIPMLTPVPTAPARAFVSRLFSIPSSILHHRSESLQQQESVSNEEENNVVLYPIVGFRYVQDAPGHSRALPTVFHASCVLPPGKDEVLVGWYSPACHLKQQDKTTARLQP